MPNAKKMKVEVRRVCETCRWWSFLRGVPAVLLVCKQQAGPWWMMQTGAGAGCSFWQAKS